MRVGQLSESDAVDVLRLPFYSLKKARVSHVQDNHFGLVQRARPPAEDTMGTWRA